MVQKIGTINKAWAAAVAAPIADWLTGIGADALFNCCKIATPDNVQLAASSILVGLVVYYVPNLSSE